MFSVQREIKLSYDFTTRVCKNFVNDLVLYKSNISFIFDGKEVNAKSSLGLISANLKKDDVIFLYMSNRDFNIVNAEFDKVSKTLTGDKNDL